MNSGGIRSILKPARRLAALAVAIVLITSQVGCVERRFTIRSNPPGARVYVDDYEIGTTPVAHDFIYYGTRKIRLVKDGYETLTVLQPIPTPWYEIPPLDFFAENVVPNKIHDDRLLDFQLQPQIIVPTEQLLGRAEELRHSTQQPQITAPGVRPGLLPPGVAPVAQPPLAQPAQPGMIQPGALPPGTLSAPGTMPPGAAPPGFVPAPQDPQLPNTAQPGFVPGTVQPTPAPAQSFGPQGYIPGANPQLAPPGAAPPQRPYVLPSY